MSLHGHINTVGIIPLVFEKELYIVDGGLRGSMFPCIYGKPYKYDEYVWGTGKKPSKEELITEWERIDKACNPDIYDIVQQINP